MKVLIRTLLNKNLEFDIEPDNTVEYLIDLVSSKDQIPFQLIRLLFRGRELAPSNIITL
jgi:hypothetical protein